MNCHYCQAQNESDAHRCGRCGRRLRDDRASFPVQHGALAAALQPENSPQDFSAETAAARVGPQLVTELPKAPASEQRGAGVQGVLFGPMEVARPAAQPRPSARPSGQTRRRTPLPDLQGKLEFDVAAEGSRTLPTSVEAFVYADAPVARAAHRAVAGAIDCCIPVLGWAIVVASFHLAGGDVQFTKATVPYYAAALLLVSVLYRLVYCFGNADTAGTQLSGLRLLNFDGHAPTRRQRFLRLGAGVISLVSAGIGAAWALLDEERLTWHDHMSKTFPSPRNY